MSDYWFDIQAYVISKRTHSYVRWYMLRLHRGVHFWLLRQLLLPEYLFGLPPPIFARNYHQAQPTVLSVVIGSDLRGVNWWLLRQLLPTDRPNPAQSPNPLFCVESSSGKTHISVRWYRLRSHKGVNYWLSRQLLSTDRILTRYPTPLFCAELSSDKTHSYVC